jgi:hypothetical protein
MPGPIQWSEHLLRGKPVRSVTLVVAIGAISVAAGLAAREWLVGALAALALGAVSAEAWVGCRCSIDARGAVRAGPFRRRSIQWGSVVAFDVTQDGATLAARRAGRGVSFHFTGIAAVERERVHEAARAWRCWWNAGRAEGSTDA